MKRDLKADSELCNKATPGPWSTIDRLSKYVTNTGEVKSFTREQFIQSEQETICTTYKPKNKHNAEFIAEAREGWPHAIERALKAEKQLEELPAWEKPKEKCYLSAMRRIAELESLVRELVDALDFMLGDKSTRTDWLVEMGKTYSKAKEVLGDE